MKKNLLKGISFALTLGLTTFSFAQTTFNYTGAMETYTVPVGVSSIQIECTAGGGFGAGGEGGYVSGEFTVTPGEVLEIYVGGQGTASVGGFNGGGNTGGGSSYGAGGGASDVRQAGSTLNDRIIVAGAGGGTGGNCGTDSAPGGKGGGLTGESGCLYSCSDCQYTGAGGSQIAGGITGPTGHGSCTVEESGTFGLGGNNLGGSGTGGGGGYYGGGAGCYEGAGGGSSYTDGSAANVTHTVGTNAGDGQIVITILCTPLVPTFTATTICEGDSVNLAVTSSNGGNITWDMGITNGVTFLAPSGVTTYTATSDDISDCGLSQDVTVNVLPVVSATAADSLVCFGEMVTLTGSGAATYAWDNGASDGVAYVPASGPGLVTFTVTGTDTNNCEAADGVDIMFSDPTITAVITNENAGNDGAIDLIVTNTSGGQTYSWSNSETTEDITGLIAGTYTITIDDGGCIADSTFTIFNVASIGGNNTTAFHIYPNPARTNFTVEQSGQFDYTLTNLSGKTILSGKAFDKEILSLEGLAKGVYTITLRTETSVNTLKIIKE
jgi:hypothetical protein